jgi:hypothetical protein
LASAGILPDLIHKALDQSVWRKIKPPPNWRITSIQRQAGSDEFRTKMRFS